MSLLSVSWDDDEEDKSEWVDRLSAVTDIVGSFLDIVLGLVWWVCSSVYNGFSLTALVIYVCYLWRIS